MQTPGPHHASIVLHPGCSDGVRVVIRRVHGGSGFAARGAAQSDRGAEVARILGSSRFVQKSVGLLAQAFTVVA